MLRPIRVLGLDVDHRSFSQAAQCCCLGFRDDYVFDYQGTSPLVSGMYFDDWWPETGGFPDSFPNMVQDMGLTPADQMAISKSYQASEPPSLCDLACQWYSRTRARVCV